MCRNAWIDAGLTPEALVAGVDTGVMSEREGRGSEAWTMQRTKNKNKGSDNTPDPTSDGETCTFSSQPTMLCRYKVTSR